MHYGSFYNPPSQKPLFQSLESVRKVFGNEIIQRCNTICLLASSPDQSWVTLPETRRQAEDAEEEKYESNSEYEQNSARVMTAMIPFLCEAINSYAESGDRKKLQEGVDSFKKVIGQLKAVQTAQMESHIGYQAGNAFMNMLMFGWFTGKVVVDLGKSCLASQSNPVYQSQLNTCISYSDEIITAIENELSKQNSPAQAMMSQ